MKYALVTGGTKGIGKGIVISLLDKGYIVIATYANDTNVAKKFKESVMDKSENLYLFRCNQSKIEEVYQLINFIKTVTETLDCLICNAGITVRKPFEDITDKDWGDVMQVAVTSNFVLVRDLKKIISANSRIVFIGSMMGILPHATSLVYGVSKASTHALALNLVKEFENTGTTVNVIVPGFVETDWQKDKPLHIKQNICNKTAVGRFAEIAEVVSAVEFCLNNGFVNGSMIEVSGGYNYK